MDDAENRKALDERFKYSQRVMQDCPWEARAENGVDAHEFSPLKIVA